MTPPPHHPWTTIGCRNDVLFANTFHCGSGQYFVRIGLLGWMELCFWDLHLWRIVLPKSPFLLTNLSLESIVLLTTYRFMVPKIRLPLHCISNNKIGTPHNRKRAAVLVFKWRYTPVSIGKTSRERTWSWYIQV